MNDIETTRRSRIVVIDNPLGLAIRDRSNAKRKTPQPFVVTRKIPFAHVNRCTKIRY